MSEWDISDLKLSKKAMKSFLDGEQSSMATSKSTPPPKIPPKNLSLRKTGPSLSRTTASRRPENQTSHLIFTPHIANIHISTEPAQAANNIPKFRHEPLEKSTPHIRLIELDTKSDDITCTVIITTLSAAPAYEALSYCWGPETPKHRITLNDRYFDVNPNLFAALRMLKDERSLYVEGTKKKMEPVRRLWIDAICINQEDIEERNNQVRLMWSIYSNAKRVLVWLGEAADQSDIAMRMVEFLGQRGKIDILAEKAQHEADKGKSPQSRSGGGRVYNDGLDHIFTSIADLENAPSVISGFAMWSRYSIDSDGITRHFEKYSPPRVVTDYDELSKVPFHLLWQIAGSEDAPDPEEWIALKKLLSRPWWLRVWVIQEVAAAKGEIIVGCGKTWLDWNSFAFAESAMTKYRTKPGLDRLNRLGDKSKAIVDKHYLTITKNTGNDRWDGLWRLLSFSKEYQATDPRDKIFALLGFTPSLDITPDYKMSVEQLYTDVVRQFIAKSCDLGILMLSRQPKSYNLPSWVPDFSLSVAEDVYNCSRAEGLFGADGNAWHNYGVPLAIAGISNERKPGELLVKGLLYDTPLAIGRVWSSSFDERQSSVYDILQHYEHLLLSTDRQYFPDQTSQHRTEQFWRTLIWNASEGAVAPARREYGDYFKDLRDRQHFIAPLGDAKLDRMITSNKPWKPDLHNKHRALPVGTARIYYEAFVASGLNRRFFITSKGHLGSGPAELRSTDKIFILLGCQYPAILRPAGDGFGRYTWVGQAYIHGIMYGEGLSDPRQPRDPGSTEVRSTLNLQNICLV